MRGGGRRSRTSVLFRVYRLLHCILSASGLRLDARPGNTLRVLRSGRTSSNVVVGRIGNNINNAEVYSLERPRSFITKANALEKLGWDPTEGPQCSTLETLRLSQRRR